MNKKIDGVGLHCVKDRRYLFFNHDFQLLLINTCRYLCCLDKCLINNKASENQLKFLSIVIVKLLLKKSYIDDRYTMCTACCFEFASICFVKVTKFVGKARLSEFKSAISAGNH